MAQIESKIEKKGIAFRDEHLARNIFDKNFMYTQDAVSIDTTIDGQYFTYVKSMK